MLHKMSHIGPFETEGCGCVAYQYDHRPYEGEKSDAKHVVNPSPAINGQPVACLSCDQPVGPGGSEPEGGWAAKPSA